MTPIALKLGIGIVSFLVTILLGTLLDKAIGPTGSFLFWSNDDLRNALFMLIAIPATFVVLYIGLSQRYQGLTGRAALGEAIVALVIMLLGFGLYAGFQELHWKYRFRQKERLRDALTTASPYTITAMKEGVVTAQAADGTTIRTTSPLFLYTLGNNEVDLSAVPRAIEHAIAQRPYRMMLSGRVGELAQDEAGHYLVQHNKLTFVSPDGTTLTAPELLLMVVRQIGVTRQYEQLSYLHLTEDHQRHYAHTYLTSSTGDTIIYTPRLARCANEDNLGGRCGKLYSMLSSGINYHRLHQPDYRYDLYALAIVNQPVALTGVDTPQGFFVYQVQFLD